MQIRVAGNTTFPHCAFLNENDRDWCVLCWTQCFSSGLDMVWAYTWWIRTFWGPSLSDSWQNLAFVVLALEYLWACLDSFLMPNSLRHWITTKWCGPAWNHCLVLGAGPVTLNWKCSFSVLKYSCCFSNIPAKSTFKSEEIQAVLMTDAMVRPDIYIHSFEP